MRSLVAVIVLVAFVSSNVPAFTGDRKIADFGEIVEEFPRNQVVAAQGSYQLPTAAKAGIGVAAGLVAFRLLFYSGRFCFGR